MQLTQKGKISALIIFACAAFSLLSIPFGFFPHLGLSISLISFAFLAFYIKNDKTPDTTAFFAIALILSIALTIRSEPSVIMLNLLAIFYFGILFVLTKKEDPESILSLIFAPLILFLQSVFILNEYQFN